MKAMLRGVSGPAMGMEVVLEPGVTVLVGRHANATLPVPNDSYLSGRHCELTLTDQGVVLRDVGSSNGTFVDEERIQAFLLPGDGSFRAGGSVFRIELNVVSVPSVFDLLSSQPEAVYAVLDAARDPAIYPMLLTSGGFYTSLYAGQAALKLEAVSPYLVYLPPQSALLQRIVESGWGQSWGIFLTSSQSAETVWHELRRSLMVTMEETGKYVYFRFYDPRVLRVFLPVADPEQRAQLFGTISSVLMEAEDGSAMLRFAARAAFPEPEIMAVQVAAKKAAQPTPLPNPGDEGTRMFKVGSR